MADIVFYDTFMEYFSWINRKLKIAVRIFWIIKILILCVYSITHK